MKTDNQTNLRGGPYWSQPSPLDDSDMNASDWNVSDSGEGELSASDALESSGASSDGNSSRESYLNYKELQMEYLSMAAADNLVNRRVFEWQRSKAVLYFTFS